MNDYEKKAAALYQARVCHGGIPADAKEVIYPEGRCVVYLYTIGTSARAIAFEGNRVKPCWSYRFGSEDKRAEYVSEWVNTCTAREREREVSRRTVEAYRHPLKVGQVLYSTWGYEQTNVDFYKVVRVLPKSVEIQEIGTFKRYSGAMVGTALPDPKGAHGEPFRRRVKPGEVVSIDGFRRAYPWDGKPRPFTEYA